MTEEIKTHPVQTPAYRYGMTKRARCPQVVTLHAYEVYSKVYGPKEALITGECRGGFSTGELIAFLYARSFPQNEWRQRVDEAMIGMIDL